MEYGAIHGSHYPRTLLFSINPCPQDVPIDLRAHISRVLHTRVVHRREKANLPLLQGKSRSQADVPQSLGQTAFVVRKFVELDPISRRLATAHHYNSARNQLEFGIGVKRKMIAPSVHDI